MLRSSKMEISFTNGGKKTCVFFLTAFIESQALNFACIYNRKKWHDVFIDWNDIFFVT